jgi:RimJ/RimL family protein N-acetyltransferase
MDFSDITLPIGTARLSIRRLQASDADARFALHTDPEYVRFIGHTIDHERFNAQFIRELNGETNVFIGVVSVKDEEQMIGESLLVPLTDAEVELVIAILPHYRKLGYGREVAEAMIAAAFQVPQISGVSACVEEANAVSRRLVESLDMRETGMVHRQDGTTPRRFEMQKTSNQLPNVSCSRTI